MEWKLYFSEHPFGQHRQDYLLGTLIQFVYNALRGPDSNPLKLEDILYPKVIDQGMQVESDLAYLDAMVTSGKVIDIRERRKK
jgi:Protein of unknown function (DUF4035)